MGTTIENLIEKINDALSEANYLKECSRQTPEGRETSILVTDLEKVYAYAHYIKFNKELRRVDEEQAKFESKINENSEGDY